MLTVLNAAGHTQKSSSSSSSSSWPPPDAFASIQGAGASAEERARVVLSLPAGPAAAPAHTGHALVLNKFPVHEGHMVIVSKQFRSQSAPMSLEDVTALWAWCVVLSALPPPPPILPSNPPLRPPTSPLSRSVVAVDGLGFYNGGFRSGASQPRRHMQVLPLGSLTEAYPSTLRGALTTPALAGVRVPLDAAIKGILEASRFAVTPGEPVPIPAYAGFVHGFAFLGGDAVSATAGEGGAAVHRVYQRLLAHVGLADAGAAAAASSSSSLPASPDADESSHNVVLTTRWMLVVPRSRESWAAGGGGAGVSVNALGYAGLLLARANSPAKAELEAAGPMAALKGCGVPPPGGR